MARPSKKDDEQKYSCPVRTYVRPSTHAKLLQFCKDMKIVEISFVVRRIVELVDNYPENKPLLQTLFKGETNT